MPHQLAQLPGGRWSNPCLGQPAHPQQIRQIRRVTLIVFHPPIGKHLHPQRVGQMHLRAQLGQHIRRPVPAVRGFQHHFRRLPSTNHHRAQILRIVRDPHRLQMLASFSHPHQHRPAPMQIHPHDLSTRIHFTPRGLLRRGSEHPENASGPHKERRPRSFITSTTGSAATTKR
jgi:hypothetical protein